MSTELTTIKRSGGLPRETIPLSEAEKHNFFKPYIPETREVKMERIRQECFIGACQGSLFFGALGGIVCFLLIGMLTPALAKASFMAKFSGGAYVGMWLGSCGGVATFFALISLIISSVVWYIRCQEAEKISQSEPEIEIPLHHLEQAIETQKNNITQQELTVQNQKQHLNQLESLLKELK